MQSLITCPDHKDVEVQYAVMCWAARRSGCISEAIYTIMVLVALTGKLLRNICSVGCGLLSPG